MADQRRLDDRGVSEVIGFVLVFALILGTVIFVSTSGLSGLEAVRSAEQVDNAERAFDVVAENIAEIYRHGAPSRTTEIDLASASLSLGSPINVNVSNGSRVLSDQDITPIVYGEGGDEHIVYVGGAVFRTRDGSGVVLRDPPIRVTDQGMALTVVGTRSRTEDSVAGGTVRLRAERSNARLKAFDTTGAHGTLWVNVTSPRWELWEQALDEPRVDCLSGADTPTDVVACEVYSGGAPDRVAITLVQMDLELSA